MDMETRTKILWSAHSFVHEDEEKRGGGGGLKERRERGGGEEGQGVNRRMGRGGGAKRIGMRGEDGKGDIQGTYWTRDMLICLFYLLVSCSKQIEGVDSILPPKKVPASTSLPTSNFSIIV